MSDRSYTFAEVRYLIRGLVADQVLGLALWLVPPSDKQLLAKTLVPYWKEIISRAEATGTPKVTQ